MKRNREAIPKRGSAATQFALTAVALQRAGTPIGSMDTMIAGHAIALGSVLVTSNERHFSRVPGLTMENWIRRQEELRRGQAKKFRQKPPRSG